VILEASAARLKNARFLVLKAYYGEIMAPESHLVKSRSVSK